MNVTKAVGNTGLMVAAGLGAHFWPAETIAVVLMLWAIIMAEGRS